MEASRRDDKRGETGNGARLAHPRLKGCTRTEFQACAQYLLGISSRHISVVTRRIPAPEQSPHRPYPPPPRPLDTRRYFICKEPCLQVAASSYLVCTGISRLDTALRDTQISQCSTFLLSFLAYLYFSFALLLPFLSLVSFPFNLISFNFLSRNVDNDFFENYS